MKSIGGFFELELPDNKGGFHKNAISLSTGRACLNLMLSQIKPRKCFLPYYTCNALFDPFKINCVEYEYYPINRELEPVEYPELLDDEYFLYINYFGIKKNQVTVLIDKYQDKLLIDDTHNFFFCGYKGNWSFTSARKYFGVPDGAFLYSPEDLDVEIDSTYERFNAISIDHSFERMMGQQDEAYQKFLKYEKSLNSDINLISNYSDRMLAIVDYDEVMKRRINNFLYLHNILSKYNEMSIQMDNMMESMHNPMVPFCYPFLPREPIEKQDFYNNNLFIPSLWSDTNNRGVDGFDFEKQLSMNLLPLPIDHRYDKEDMKRLAEYVKQRIEVGK